MRRRSRAARRSIVAFALPRRSHMSSRSRNLHARATAQLVKPPRHQRRNGSPTPSVAGLVAFRTAAATHVDGLRRLFFDKLAVGELESLYSAWDRVGPDSACAREQRLRSTRDD
jgi:hypothetical protein